MRGAGPRRRPAADDGRAACRRRSCWSARSSSASAPSPTSPRRPRAGAATVVRLAAKLGFDGFSALQASIQRDLARQLRPAAERIRELGGDQPIAAPPRGRAVQRPGHARRRRPGDARGRRRPARRPRPRGARARRRRRARHRPAVRHRPRRAARRRGRRSAAATSPCAGSSPSAEPGATLLVIDLRRYERWVLEAFEQGKGAGHTIVALTDGVLSPLAMGAHHSFAISAGVGVAVRQPRRHAGAVRPARRHAAERLQGVGGRTACSASRAPGPKPARSPILDRRADTGPWQYFVMTEMTRCRWCRRVLPERGGRGRPREFCSARCRQWDWVARQRASELELSEGELVITRAALDELHDDLYVLACAVDDVERDLADVAEARRRPPSTRLAPRRRPPPAQPRAHALHPPECPSCESR